MLLTLSASSSKPNLDLKPPPLHDSKPFFSPPPTSRLAHKGFDSSNSSSSYRPLQASGASAMSGPHRGLPPPSAMTLPDPSRSSDASRGLPPSMPHFQHGVQQMPAPPPQWQGAEESMKNWLAARTEEERRKQEEEKTRQENLRLEQRRIEQSMLRDSMQAGIPPHLIPVIFAGISGTNVGFEVLQNYYAHMQSSAPQLPQQGSPDSRRDSRLLNQPQAGVLFPSALPSHTASQQDRHESGPVVPAHSIGGSPSFQASFSGRPRAHTTGQAGALTAPPRPSGGSTLPRLTTNEMHIVQPAMTQHPLHQSQSAQNVQHESHAGAPQSQQQQSQPQQSSPSIYFHHWVPPSSQASTSNTSNAPPTPSGNKPQSSSISSTSASTHQLRQMRSHTAEPDHSISPKKRKAQGSHHAQPPPAQHTSPSFSHTSSAVSTPGRRGHGRTRSDLDSSSRPTSHPGSGGLGSSSGRGGAASGELGHSSGPTSRRESSVDGGAAAASSSLVEQHHTQQYPPQQSRRTSSTAEQGGSFGAFSGAGAGGSSAVVGRRNDGPAGAQHETASSTPVSPSRPPATAAG